MKFDGKTEEEVFAENEKIVDFAIRKYFSAEVGILEYEDLRQEGAIALVRAIRNYDENAAKFSTYAIKCIRQAIRRYIELNRYDLHVPPARQHEAFRNGEEALDNLLKTCTTISLDHLPVKVDGKRNKDKDACEYRISIPIETLQKQLGIEDDAISSVQMQEIGRLFNSVLSEREKEIFLAYVKNGASAARTARALGISSTRVSVVRDKFRELVRLAGIFEKDGLADYGW